MIQGKGPSSSLLQVPCLGPEVLKQVVIVRSNVSRYMQYKAVTCTVGERRGDDGAMRYRVSK